MLTSHHSVSLTRRTLLFLAVFTAILACIYVSNHSPHSDGGIMGGWWFGSTDSQVGLNQSLVHDAKLVDHFCLNRIPPLLGKTTVPNEWETALNCEVRVGDAVGELVSISTGLAPQLAEIKTLQAGQYRTCQSTIDGEPIHEIIYRSTGNPNLFLLLRRHNSPHSDGGTKGGQPPSFPRLSILLAALGALIIAYVSPKILLPR